MHGIRVLVTGANGFVGRHVAAYLAGQGCLLTLAVRNTCDCGPAERRIIAIGDLSSATQWSKALDGVTAVVHTAGLAHHIGPGTLDDADYFRVNSGGTGSLARDIAQNATPILINLSSIAVYSPDLGRDRPLTEASECMPESAYGRSKLEAEQVVAALASPALSAIQLRPPLIYGDGARGNWPRFEALAASPLPMPSIAPNNRRSVLGIQNLCDAIWCAMKFAGNAPVTSIFNIADEGYVSTDDLARWVRQRRHRRFGIVPGTAVPIQHVGKALGYQETLAKLTGDLMIDASKFHGTFTWKPPHTTREGLLQDKSGRR
jgi:nucleoside-diphosphate-sugar epimerase